MVEIYLYGRLRRHASDSRADRESVIRLPGQPQGTIRTALEEVGIDPDEVCHVFLNGMLLSTRNPMGPWLRYQQAEAQGLDASLEDGDRLGVFGRDMALLVV